MGNKKSVMGTEEYCVPLWKMLFQREERFRSLPVSVTELPACAGERMEQDRACLPTRFQPRAYVC